MKLKTEAKQSLLWRFKEKGSDNYSYIYGTIHLKDNRVYFLVEKLKDLIGSCDIFIAEYDLDDSNQSEIFEAMQLPDNKHLKQYLPDRKFQKLKKQFLSSFNIDLERFGFFKPIALENLITESLFSNDFNFPLDFELWNYARSEGKITKGAESTKSQIHILKNLSIKNQIKSILKIGYNLSKYKKKLTKLISLYEKQDLKLLYKSSLKPLGKLKKVLVYDRNIKIAESICDNVKNGTVFVALGAGHLPGEKGVLRILKKKGFIVEPVKTN
jgi:hypothetical protein